MLFCCHKYFHNTEKRYLLDTFKHNNRILEFGTCPKCGTLKALLTYKDNTGHAKEHKPKKKRVREFINDCLKQPYYELKDLKEKHGTKNNVFWLYQTNGMIKDFNNQTKGTCKTDLNIINIRDISDSAPVLGAFI